MAKFTFKYDPAKTGLAAIGNSSRSSDIKLKGKRCGRIEAPNWRSKDDLYYVKFMVIDKEEYRGWKVLHEEGAQGFVDNGGKYYTREEAIQFVKDTGQFYDPQLGNHQESIEDCDVAFSEGFW